MIREQKGQALLEMALLLPLLLLLIGSVFDFGRILYSYMHLNLATQESARLGGLGKGDTEIDNFARNYLHMGDASLLEVIISPSELYRKSGDYVKVTLRYPFETVTPVISEVIPSPYMIETDSTIRVE